MNNNVLYGVVFGLLGFSGIVLGMELEMSKDQSKNEYFSLFIKNNGVGVIKKCTIDYQKTKSTIVKESQSMNLVKTMPIRCEKIKEVEDVNFAILGPLLDKGERFHFDIQVSAEKKERYVIDQVTVKSWPIQWDEIKNKKFGSLGKYFTSDPVVYDLHDNKATDVATLNCSTINETQESPMIEIFESVGSIALVVYMVYFFRNNPMALTLFPKL